MKSLKVLLVFFFLANISFAQWVQTNGPEGGDIQCITKFNSNIFCGTLGGGLFKSIDDGISWKPANNGLPTDYIYCLAVSGNNLFTSIYGGVFLSSDNGSNWHEVNNGLENNHVTALAATDSKLAAATEAGVFLSTNNGTSWTFLNGSPWYVSALALTDTSIYAGSIYSGLYYYNFRDTIWQFIGLTDLNISGVAVVDNVLLATTVIAGMVRSSDNGISWYQTDGYGWNFTVSDSIVYVAGYGISKSVDKGLTWIDLTQENMFLNVLAVDSPNLYAGGFDGAFRSTDDGTSWTMVNTGLINTTSYFLGSIYSNIFTPVPNYASGESEPYLSSDNGESWYKGGQGLTDLSRKNINCFLQKDDYIFAATDSGIYLSSDSGISWSGRGFAGEWINTIVSQDTFIFAGRCILSGGGVFRTSNYGLTWDSVFYGYFASDYSSMAVSKEYIFLNRNAGGVLRSSNYGLTWSQLPAPGSGSWSMAALDDKIFYQGENNIYVSSDYGTNWITCSGFPSEPRVNSFIVSDSIIFALTNWGTLYQCTYSSNVFTLVDPDFSSWINSVAVYESNIFASVAGKGIWRMPLPGVTSVDSYSEIPAEFFLEQNYPNPFNPSTTIGFTIPASANITVEIYDILGSKAAILLNEVKPAGRHQVQWNAAGFASGIYICQLRAGDFIQSRKMILLR
jgi:photosystem II stability/assembly factor-like uncharacterized protein